MTTFLNARSKASASSPSTSFAVSMNRLDCSASSGFGFGLRPIARRYSRQSSKGNRSWNGGSDSRFRMSCFVGQSLALRALHQERSALYVAITKTLAGILAEIELGQLADGVVKCNVAESMTPENIVQFKFKTEKPYDPLAEFVDRAPFRYVNRDGKLILQQLVTYHAPDGMSGRTAWEYIPVVEDDK